MRMFPRLTRVLFATDEHYDSHGDDDHGGHEAPFTFEELMGLCATVYVIFLGGKLAGKFCGLPELVGQILCGILVGPHGLDVAPKHESLMLIGELGLAIMVLEAGLEVELSQLQLVGGRGVMVAILGSVCPLLIGFGLAMGVFDMEYKSALAVGASLAPTSMGISLKVLEEGKVLTTPTGQLIIAAAVIDDVIALVLLAQLEALEDPSLMSFLIPIIASLAFIFVFGFLAIKVIPKILAEHIVPRLPVNLVEPILLGMVFAGGYGLMAACHYGKSSHLLGAFLGGLSFCTLASVKGVWHHKVKQTLQWLIRIFFACTIGFEVPIRDIWTAPVLTRAAVFLFGALGKLVTGLLAKPFAWDDAAKIGFAMAAWGEFAFIVATASKEAGTLDDDTYGAVLLAVLLSAIYSPFAVKMAINWGESKGDNQKSRATIARKFSMMSFVRRGGELPMRDNQLYDDEGAVGASNTENNLHAVYYECCIKCRSKWGLNDQLMKAINLEMSLDIIDFRVHTVGGWTMFDLYFRDRELRAPNKDVPEYKDKIDIRLDGLLKAVLTIAGVVESDFSTGMVQFKRWLPLLDENNDDGDDEKAYHQAEFEFRSSEVLEELSVKNRKTRSKLGRINENADVLLSQDLVNSDADDILRQAVNEGRRRTSKELRGDIGLGAANHMRRRFSGSRRTSGDGSSLNGGSNGSSPWTATDSNVVTISATTGSQLANEVRKHMSEHGAMTSYGRSREI